MFKDIELSLRFLLNHYSPGTAIHCYGSKKQWTAELLAWSSDKSNKAVVRINEKQVFFRD